MGSDNPERSGDPIKDISLYHLNANGSRKVVQIVRRVAPNVPLSLARGGVALTNGGISFLGSAIREREYMGKNGRHIQVVGHQFLSQLTTYTGGGSSASCTVGSRLRGGVHLLSPDAFGGRLALLSQMFEQHKVNKLTIVYNSLVAATEPGSIAMYARNDTSTPTVDTGIDELSHAATHNSFKQSNVWQSFKMDIDPSDVQQKYWDEPGNNSRLTFQGVLQVLAASTLADNLPIGDLYVEFDIDFYGEELNYEIKDVHTSYATFAYLFSTGDAALEGQPIPWYFNSSTPAANAITNVAFTDPPDTPRYIAYGVVRTAATALPALKFTTQADATERTVACGMGLWLCMAELPSSTSWTDSTKFGFLAVDAESCLEANPNAAYWNVPETPGNGVLCYSGTNLDADVGAFSMDLRFLALENTIA